MKLMDFFINCLNRRSFQFLSVVGLIIFIIPITYWKIACINEYVANVYLGGFEVLLFLTFMFILPTYGLITILSIIAIYIKLLIREHKKSEYRIKNKFLTQNPVYGFVAFIFYIFAVVSIVGLLYMAGQIIVIHKIYEDSSFYYPIYIYPFITYVLIHIFIIFII